MIDPSKITNFNLSDKELEEMVIFWVLVAGKNAKTTSKLLQKFLEHLHKIYNSKGFCPFEVIAKYDIQNPGKLESLLKEFGFGCQKSKAKSLRALVSCGLDFKTCTIEQLEKIHGIGMKTSRCFLIHTRANARNAGLDTHVLKWLRRLGYDVPKSTPSKGEYLELEKIFVQIADILRTPTAQLDLTIWNAYSSGDEYLIDNKYMSKLPKYKKTLSLC